MSCVLAAFFSGGACARCALTVVATHDMGMSIPDGNEKMDRLVYRRMRNVEARAGNKLRTAPKGAASEAFPSLKEGVWVSRPEH
jgi:hypothetical protein